MTISIYTKYSPTQLESALMGEVGVGDADELHNALIVLAGICDRQDTLIKRLSETVAELANRLNAVESIQDSERGAS